VLDMRGTQCPTVASNRKKRLSISPDPCPMAETQSAGTQVCAPADRRLPAHACARQNERAHAREQRETCAAKIQNSEHLPVFMRAREKRLAREQATALHTTRMHARTPTRTRMRVLRARSRNHTHAHTHKHTLTHSRTHHAARTHALTHTWSRKRHVPGSFHTRVRKRACERDASCLCVHAAPQ